MEVEVIEQRLADYQISNEKRLVDFDSDIKIIKLGLEERVKFSTFTWVLGILMVITMGLLGLIYPPYRSYIY